MYIQIKDILKSRSYGGHLTKNWVKQDLPRFAQLMADQTTRSKISIFSFARQKKIIMHSSSCKVMQSNSFYPTVIDLAFSTIGCQTPTAVYSRKSIAEFKVAKDSIVGSKTTLRSLLRYDFYYKLYFLAAAIKLSPQEPSTTPEYAGKNEHSQRTCKATIIVIPQERYFTTRNFLESINSSTSFIREKNNKNNLQWLLQTTPKRVKQRLFPVGGKVALRPIGGKVALRPFGKAPTEDTINTDSVMLKGNSQRQPASGQGFAVNNVFLFNELDCLEYETFDRMPGFEIQFNNEN
jgi:hypothetical protein